MKGKIKQNKEILAASLTITVLLLTAFTTAQVTSQDHGEEHTLEGNMLATESSQTEATFRAEITGLSENYDAALVYWNYTNQDTGEEFKGPANIALEQGGTVQSVQPGLETGTGYGVEAYAEPVVVDDETLGSNAGDTLADRAGDGRDILWAEDNDVIQMLSGSETAMQALSGSEDVMQAVAEDGEAVQILSESEDSMQALSESETAMQILSDSENAFSKLLLSTHSLNTLWTKDAGSTGVWESFGPEPPETFDRSELTLEDSPTGGKLLRFTRVDDIEDRDSVEKNIDFTDVDRVKIKIRVDTFGDPGSRMQATVKIDGDELINLDGGNDELIERELDVSQYSGVQTLELIAEGSRLGSSWDNYEVEFDDFYLEQD